MIEKGVEFSSHFAAPSISTGNFVASIIDSDFDTIRSAFDDPGKMLVHNTDNLYPDVLYEHYSGIKSIKKIDEGIIVLIRRKEK